MVRYKLPSDQHVSACCLYTDRLLYNSYYIINPFFTRVKTAQVPDKFIAIAIIAMQISFGNENSYTCLI